MVLHRRIVRHDVTMFEEPIVGEVTSIVTPEDYVPAESSEDTSANFLTLPAPWEFVITPFAEDPGVWSAHFVCPRCLDVGSMSGHEVTLQGKDVEVSKGTSEPLEMFAGELDTLRVADNPSVTVEPSIGCRGCGFHCYLRDGEFEVLSDWGGDDGQGEQAFDHSVEQLRKWRPDVHDKLVELTED